MTITLYTNNSEITKVRKSITELATYTGTLRENTNLLTPTILLDSSADIVLQSNYAYIQEFGRYYFVGDITIVNDSLYQVPMRCDVLMSHADDILRQRAIIARQENQYNLYLNDTMFKTYQDPIIITKRFSESFDENSNSLVLVAAGGWTFDTP